MTLCQGPEGTHTGFPSTPLPRSSAQGHQSQPELSLQVETILTRNQPEMLLIPEHRSTCDSWSRQLEKGDEKMVLRWRPSSPPPPSMEQQSSGRRKSHMELLDYGVFHTGRKRDLENLFCVKTPSFKHRLNLGDISPRNEFYHYSSFSQKTSQKIIHEKQLLTPISLQ